jgi:hypothetical protein
MDRFWWIVGLAAAGQAEAAGETVKLGPTRLEMPARIGPLASDGAAHSFGSAALGVGYQYSGAGMSLTIYVYNAGVDAIPDGGDTIAACRQFEQAKGDILGAGYANTTLKSQQLVRLAPPDDVPLAREAVLEFERENQAMISYLWITGFDRNFVKLRFSLDARLRDEAGEARRAVLDALGVAIKPHLVAQPASDKPEDEKTGTSINLALGMGSDDDMAAGMMYTILLAGLAEKSPEQMPVCGGLLVPGFESELEIFRMLMAMEVEGDQSRFGKQLADAQAAGMLEEMVWTDLHRDEWGKSAPEGLTLDEYKSWKKKHLKRFRRPKFGEIVIDRPRPMPLESAQ